MRWFIIDLIIKVLKKKPEVLELLGRVWEMLYIEGSTPDIGKRRENFIRMFLKKEFGLEVTPAPSMERKYDFEITINNEKRKYSLKTTESITTIKVAWNGFPSLERARKFKFEYPILYVTGDRSKKKISIYVFDVEDLEKLKEEMGDSMWWIPEEDTNPRGFGLSKRAVEKLMEIAKVKGNYIAWIYNPIDVNAIKERYWNEWYNLLKKLASIKKVS